MTAITFTCDFTTNYVESVLIKTAKLLFFDSTQVFALAASSTHHMVCTNLDERLLGSSETLVRR
jgi:hypothetical protein